MAEEDSSVLSVNGGKKRRRVVRKRHENWLDEEVMHLISLWKEKLKALSMVRRRRLIYEEMSARLALLKVQRGAEEIRGKLKNLTSIYRELKKRCALEPAASAEWKFYELVDGIFSQDVSSPDLQQADDSAAYPAPDTDYSATSPAPDTDDESLTPPTVVILRPKQEVTSEQEDGTEGSLEANPETSLGTPPNLAPDRAPSSPTDATSPKRLEGRTVERVLADMLEEFRLFREQSRLTDEAMLRIHAESNALMRELIESIPFKNYRLTNK